jgi:hypothetical protein
MFCTVSQKIIDSRIFLCEALQKSSRRSPEVNERRITMKTLMFVTAVSVLSATGAFAQGVAFDPTAPSPVYGSYPHSPDVGLFDQGQPLPQQVRQHRLRMTTQRIGGYTKIARKKVW